MATRLYKAKNEQDELSNLFFDSSHQLSVPIYIFVHSIYTYKFCTQFADVLYSVHCMTVQPDTPWRPSPWRPVRFAFKTTADAQPDFPQKTTLIVQTGPGWICSGSPSALCPGQQQSRSVSQLVWSLRAWAGWCSSGPCWVETASYTTRSIQPSTARRASRTSASVVTLLPWHIPLPLVAAFMRSKKIYQMSYQIQALSFLRSKRSNLFYGLKLGCRTMVVMN